MADPSELNEVRGTALAAFSLSVNTLRFLQRNGTLTQHDVNSILGGVLLSLEKSGLVPDEAAHSARALLSGVAASLGVPTKSPN